MRKIESFQMKKIYAIGHALGITGNGSEDELHVLVSGVTGKDSIKELSYQEAVAVIKRLEDLQGGTAAPKPSSRKPKEHSQRPGGVTSGQLARNVAAPANAQRFDIKTPCKEKGKCFDCKSPDTICCQFLITRYSRHTGRIHVILVNENLGF